MKVVVTGPVFPDSFARNIVVTLEHMGHEVYSFAGTRALHQQNPWLRRFWTRAEKLAPFGHRLQSKLVDLVKHVQPDLVLVASKDIPPDVVAKTKAACSAPVVCWYTDPVWHLGNESNLAKTFGLFDFTFVKEPALARKLSLGYANVHLLPEACNPIWHRRVVLTDVNRFKYGSTVAGIGTLHSHRARTLEPFCDKQLRIWGDYVPRGVRSPTRRCYMNHFVAEEEKPVALLAADIVINTIGPWEFEGVNCSLFEIAGCGAFQIAASKPSLRNNFVPEQEIVTFGSPEELTEKVDYYLQRPEHRAAIADRAYRRAHAEHTYEHRLKEMLRIIGNTSESRHCNCSIVIHTL
jgi:spore maturation protein CgeB